MVLLTKTFPFDSFIPVSYTHLDVYKRQCQYRVVKMMMMMMMVVMFLLETDTDEKENL